MKTIFIASSTADLKYAKKVRDSLLSLNMKPLLWSDTNAFVPGKSILRNLIEICRTVDGAVFIFGNSDELKLKRENNNQVFVPRDNVLIEIGIFSAYLHYSRTFIVRFKNTKIATDLAGITYASYKNDKYIKKKLSLWLNKNIIGSKTDTPFREYEKAQKTINKLNRELEFSKSKIFNLAILNDINYKKIESTSLNLEFWKVVFMREVFEDLVQLIHDTYQIDKLVSILTETEFEELVHFIKYDRFEYRTRIKIALEDVVIQILEEKKDSIKFYELIDLLGKLIHDQVYLQIFNLNYFWDPKNSPYNNIGG